MTGISAIVLEDSGTYYTAKPTVVIDAPAFDSSRFTLAMIDSQEYKYGCGALKLDSNTSMAVGTLDSNYQSWPTRRHNMMSMWINLDSVVPSTLAWGQDYRIHVDSGGHIGFTWRASGTTNTIWDSSGVITQNNWHFVKIEIAANELRTGIDSDHRPNAPTSPGFYAAHTMYLGSPLDYFWDSGATINLGHDSANTSPLGTIWPTSLTPNPVSSYKGINGTIDAFNFTTSVGDSAFRDIWSDWVPESAGDYYRNNTPLFEEHWDYRRAKVHVRLDSANDAIAALTIIDSGCGYDSAPGVTITGGHSVDSQYFVGDQVNQTLSSGVVVSGEIQRVALDSDQDSNRTIYLAHVGADDGNYHTFVSNLPLENITRTNGIIGAPHVVGNGLLVNNVIELNRISETEQNELFSDNSLVNFLDFTEDNPFGDPEFN